MINVCSFLFFSIIFTRLSSLNVVSKITKKVLCAQKTSSMTFELAKNATMSVEFDCELFVFLMQTSFKFFIFFKTFGILPAILLFTLMISIVYREGMSERISMTSNDVEVILKSMKNSRFS